MPGILKVLGAGRVRVYTLSVDGGQECLPSPSSERGGRASIAHEAAADSMSSR
jgi:hypothetical protein